MSEHVKPARPAGQDSEEEVSEKGPQLLSETDVGLVRVLEDLIDVLIRKGVLQFTELPEAAQAKLLQRRTARAGLQEPLRLLGPDEEDL
jgi:hypothetical protein